MAQVQNVKHLVGQIFETTDATQSAAVTVQTETDEAYLVMAWVIAVNTADYTQAAGYGRLATFKNDGGTLAIVGSVTDAGTMETTGGWDCTLDASGTTIRVLVTGEAGKNITWRVVLDVYPVGKPSTPQVWS